MTTRSTVLALTVVRLLRVRVLVPPGVLVACWLPVGWPERRYIAVDPDLFPE